MTEENKTPEVPTPETPAAPAEKSYDEKHVKGLEAALHQQREEAKELRSKFDAIEREKAERKEKRLKEEGKLEEILNQYKSELDEVKSKYDESSKKASAFDDYLRQESEKQQAKVQELVAKIPDSHKDLVAMAIEGRDPKQQLSYIEKFISTAVPQPYNVTPSGK